MKRQMIVWKKFRENKLYDRKDDFLVICTDGEQLWVEKSYYDYVTGWDIEKKESYFDIKNGWTVDEDSIPYKVLYFAEMPFPHGELSGSIK